MAHQSLYRTYRPSTFAEVIGQEQITVPLQEQIATGKVAHAYLFAGSRGLGKTSIARIFARALNTDERDIYELDAASNNSVDEIRTLNESVHTLPFNSARKVYILDEAHMLTKSAWNAFLKTLEEPPAHVVLIMATTELEKVPDTVRSRCQVFTFKKPTRAGLAELVLSIGKKEKVAIEPAAADLIAMLGDGSFRDTLSVLERALGVAKDGKLTRQATEEATGAPSHALVHALVSAIAEGNTANALEAIATAAKQGTDMALFLALTTTYVRTILLMRHAPELRAVLQAELGEDASKDAETLVSASSSKLSHQTLIALLDATARVRFAPVPALPLELAVLELASR